MRQSGLETFFPDLVFVFASISARDRVFILFFYFADGRSEISSLWGRQLIGNLSAFLGEARLTDDRVQMPRLLL